MPTIDRINAYLQHNPRITPEHGWLPINLDQPFVNYLWTRTGDHQFTFTYPDNQSAYYRKGSKIRYKDGADFEYGVIKSVSAVLSGGSYNHTIDLIPNTDHAMAAATITDRWISYVASPEDFPGYFNFNANWTNLTGGTGKARWKVTGSNLLTVETTNLSPTSTGNVDVTMPVIPTAAADVTRHILGVVQILDSGTGQFAGAVNGTNGAALAQPRVFNASGTYVSLDRIGAAAPMAWAAGDELNTSCFFMF
jgi:hypothetical protein